MKNEFSKYIKKVLADKDITAISICLASNFDEREFYKIKSGHRKLSMKKFFKLSKMLNLSTDEEKQLFLLAKDNFNDEIKRVLYFLESMCGKK